MLTADKLTRLLPQLVAQEKMLREVYEQYGPPPRWHYEPGFGALIQIILGQQVSVASAAAAYRRLEEQVEEVTPERILALSDEELRAAYFSRQKMRYARHLAKAIMDKKLMPERLDELPDEQIRTELTRIKGIGPWTADIYLLLALQRPDIYPPGDLAAKKVLQELGLVSLKASREELLAYADRFRPYRSALTLLLWHKYIEDRGIRFLKKD